MWKSREICVGKKTDSNEIIEKEIDYSVLGPEFKDLRTQVGTLLETKKPESLEDSPEQAGAFLKVFTELEKYFFCSKREINRLI